MIISEKINRDIENKFYIKINLSFFEGDKSEAPTDKRKEKAREEGQVAMSKELQTAVLLLVSFYGLRIFANYIYKKCYALLQVNFSMIADIDKIFEKKYMTELITYCFLRVIIICLPLFAVCLIAGVITNLIQVGWKPTVKPLMPKLDKFNPISGFKKMFSMKSLVEFVKSLLVLAIVSFGIYNCLKKEVNEIQTIMIMDIYSAMIYIGQLCIKLGTTIGYYFIVIAALDLAYERYSHYKKLKMSKQEVKDEFKQSEGDPHIKGQIRQKMREISMRRMMQEVPNADVVITNPTHFAVAIKYDKSISDAPIVVAKGADHLAKRIKKVAAESGIQMVENRPLARTLYATVDVGKAIPPELYEAVAQVLSYVYQLQGKTIKKD